jgi:putative membrane protein
MSQSSDKIEKEVNASAANKLLVICVDRDNDIGEKAGIITPVIGRNACIDAAQRLALEDPEDADSNSMFAAIKTYEDLISKGYQVEVAIVAGIKKRGVQADEKILIEIKKITNVFSANGAVIVSDGEDDESVIPVIQNVLPVISVQRVVMKVSRSVEYSYAVFGKYLKMLAYDSKYSKFFLGVPGILLLIGGVATIFGYTAEIFAVLVSILGATFLIRAFDVDRAWANLTKPTPMGFIRIFTMVAGILLILSSIQAGINSVEPKLLEDKVDLFTIFIDKIIIGQFIIGALPMLWIGLGAIFAGILLSNWIGGIPRQITDILRIIVLGALYPVTSQFIIIMMSYNVDPITLVPPLLVGLAATLISATILFKKYRKHKRQEMVSD